MARTVPRLGRDGVVRLHRAGRWRWAWLIPCGLVAILPFALSIASLLPPLILAVPPLALCVAIWLVLRHAGAADPTSPPSSRGRVGRVIPLRRARRARRA